MNAYKIVNTSKISVTVFYKFAHKRSKYYFQASFPNFGSYKNSKLSHDHELKLYSDNSRVLET